MTTKNIRTPKGWTRRELADSRYPLVFTRVYNGKTFRIAPDTFETDRWTVDVACLGMYERHTNRTFATPSEAAGWFADDALAFAA